MRREARRLHGVVEGVAQFFVMTGGGEDVPNRFSHGTFDLPSPDASHTADAPATTGGMAKRSHAASVYSNSRKWHDASTIRKAQ
jgi:hypothetical protein